MSSLKPFEQLLKLAASTSRNLVGYNAMQLPGKFDNVVVAMSSGVDSSVAAGIFAEFPKARGIYMQNWSKSEDAQESCSERDWKDVEKVGTYLNLPVERVNFEQDYWIDVFEPMLRDYERGVTPNPDVGCNKYIKFGRLRSYLDNQLGKENYWLVTGHYSRVLRPQHDPSQTHLLKAYHKAKDQSYYLSQIAHDVLPALCLPMGIMTKPEVRQMARELQLPTANKPDSQGICFVANSQHGKINRFLQQYIPSHEGEIVTVDPESGVKTVWGHHTGLWNYTIGQKVGISMPQGDPRYKGAWFITEKNVAKNEMTICRGRDHPSLYKNRIVLKDFMPLGDRESIKNEIQESLASKNLFVQYRSLQDPIVVSDFHWADNNNNNSEIAVTLAHKQRAMAPGQYCTIYLNERILGSGTILRADTID